MVLVIEARKHTKKNKLLKEGSRTFILWTASGAAGGKRSIKYKLQVHFTIRFHLCPPFFSAAGRFALLLQFIGQCALNLQRCRKSKSCSAPGFKILTSAGAEYRRDFGQRFVVWSFPPTTTVAPFAASCRLMLAQKRKLKLDLCNDKTLPSERSWCILLREVHQPAVAATKLN